MSFSPQTFFREIQGVPFDNLEALEEAVRQHFIKQREDFPNHYSSALFLEWIYEQKLIVERDRKYMIDLHRSAKPGHFAQTA